MSQNTNNFTKWYLDTIQKADLFDYTPVRGCIAFKPDGYEIWEHIQAEMDKRFKETGHRNAYFPMLIPENFFKRKRIILKGSRRSFLGSQKRQERSLRSAWHCVQLLKR